MAGRGTDPSRGSWRGDAETGVCIMQMDAGLDTGPVLLRKATKIGAEETTAQLHDRLSDMGAAAIVEALAQLDDLVPEVQPEEGVTYAAKIDKAEAQVDWSAPAQEVDRKFAGFAFPGAWCEIEGSASSCWRHVWPRVRARRARCLMMRYGGLRVGGGAASALATGGQGRAGCGCVPARVSCHSGRAALKGK